MTVGDTWFFLLRQLDFDKMLLTFFVANSTTSKEFLLNFFDKWLQQNQSSEIKNNFRGKCWQELFSVNCETSSLSWFTAKKCCLFLEILSFLSGLNILTIPWRTLWINSFNNPNIKIALSVNLIFLSLLSNVWQVRFVSKQKHSKQ